ncbi:hypothetical protein GCM10027071_00030 [Microbacterium marinum]
MTFHGVSEVEKEYASAIASFPYALPRDFVFPSAPPLEVVEPDAEFQAGYGFGIALHCWTEAMEESILRAGADGDVATATSLAKLYLDASRSAHFEQLVFDPDDLTGDFLRAIIERSDFTELRAWRSSVS